MVHWVCRPEVAYPPRSQFPNPMRIGAGRILSKPSRRSSSQTLELRALAQRDASLQAVHSRPLRSRSAR